MDLIFGKFSHLACFHGFSWGPQESQKPKCLWNWTKKVATCPLPPILMVRWKNGYISPIAVIFHKTMITGEKGCNSTPWKFNHHFLVRLVGFRFPPLSIVGVSLSSSERKHHFWKMVVATSRDALEKKKKNTHTQTSFQASHWRLEMVTMGCSNCKGLLVLNRIPGLWMDSNTRMALQRKPVPKRGIWSKPGNAFCQIWKIYMGEIGWAGWLCFKRGWIEDVMASSASLDLRTPTAGKWKKISKYLSHLYSQPSKIWAGLSFCS